MFLVFFAQINLCPKIYIVLTSYILSVFAELFSFSVSLSPYSLFNFFPANRFACDSAPILRPLSWFARAGAWKERSQRAHEQQAGSLVLLRRHPRLPQRQRGRILARIPQDVGARRPFQLDTWRQHPGQPTWQQDGKSSGQQTWLQHVVRQHRSV